VKFDLQLSPAASPWPALRTAAEAADEGGFTTLWTWDHLTGALLGGDAMLECFTLLGALAASTRRIGLGSLVVNVANRNAGVMAVAAASVQAISGGRFTLGLGAGAGPGGRYSAEQQALGLEVPARVADRHRRLDRVLDRLDELWSPARDPRWAGFPLPTPRPAVLLGVNSLQLAQLAGRRAEGVNVRADHPRLAELIGAATAARARRTQPAAAGAEEIEASTHAGSAGTGAAGTEASPGTESAGTDPAGSRSAWTTSVWAPWNEELLDPGHPERRRLAALGVDRLVLVWLDPVDPDRIAAAGRALTERRVRSAR
jgi:alkanesulfonate monooxygenase SsuD/methylene tetrahydromethanopterin reductase-like flavin-dependent oxidoreductase (luciferase family)